LQVNTAISHLLVFRQIIILVNGLLTLNDRGWDQTAKANCQTAMACIRESMEAISYFSVASFFRITNAVVAGSAILTHPLLSMAQ